MSNYFDQFDAAPESKPTADNFFDQFDDKPKNESGNMVRGLKTSFQQVPQLAYGLASLAAAGVESAAGEGGLATAAKNWSVKGYQDWGQKIQAGAKDTDEFNVAYDRAKAGDFGALVDWLQYGIGYAVGQGVQILGTGGVGSLAGKVALKPAVEKFAAGMVEKGIAKGLTREEAVAHVAAEAGTLGTVGAQAFGMEGGEIGGDLVSANAGRPLTGAELARAAGATVLAGTFEFAGDALGFGAMLGKAPVGKMVAGITGLKGRATRGLLSGAMIAPVEGATEYLQTGAEEYGKGNEANILPWNQSEEAQRQAKNAAALGALGGAVIGGGGGAMTAAKPAQAPGLLNTAPIEPPASLPPSDATVISSVTDPAKTLDESIAATVGAIDKPVLTSEQLGRAQSAFNAAGLADAEVVGAPGERTLEQQQAQIAQDADANRAEAQKQREFAQPLPAEQQDANVQAAIDQAEALAGADSAAAAPAEPVPPTAMELALSKARAIADARKAKPESVAGPQTAGPLASVGTTGTQQPFKSRPEAQAAATSIAEQTGVPQRVSRVRGGFGVFPQAFAVQPKTDAAPPDAAPVQPAAKPVPTQPAPPTQAVAPSAGNVSRGTSAPHNLDAVMEERLRDHLHASGLSGAQAMGATLGDVVAARQRARVKIAAEGAGAAKTSRSDEKQQVAQEQAPEVVKRQSPFGDYSFERPIYAAIDDGGKVLTWATRQSAVAGEIDRKSNNPQWIGARIEKVTAQTADKYEAAPAGAVTQAPENSPKNERPLFSRRSSEPLAPVQTAEARNGLPLIGNQDVVLANPVLATHNGSLKVVDFTLRRPNKSVIGELQLELSKDMKQVVTLNWIDVPKTLRESGIGESVVRAILAYNNGESFKLDRILTDSPKTVEFWRGLGADFDESKRYPSGTLSLAGYERSGNGRVSGERGDAAQTDSGSGTGRTGSGRSTADETHALSSVVSVEHALGLQVGKSSKVRVTQEWTDFPENLQDAVRSEKAYDVQALYNQKTDTIWMAASNIAPGTEFAVLMHEGVHMGARKFLGEQNSDRLTNQLKAWSRFGSKTEHGKLVQKALNRIPAETTAANRDEELFAYFVEEAVKAGHGTPKPMESSPIARWFKQLWAAVRQAVAKLGADPSKLTIDDIVALARGSLENSLGTEPARQTVSMKSVRDESRRISETTGVRVHMELGVKGQITLSAITTPNDKQSQGMGSKALTEIKAFADRIGRNVVLTAKPRNPELSHRLNAFYEKNGFLKFGNDPLNKFPYFGYKAQPENSLGGARPSVNSKGASGVPTGGMQERAVRAENFGSPEPAQMSVEGAGKRTVPDFDAFAKQYEDSRPVDTRDHARRVADLANDIRQEWALGNADEVTRRLGHDQVFADLRKENAAEFFDDDGDLTDAGNKRYVQLEERLANDAARSELGEPKRQSVDFSSPGDAAQFLHDYLDAAGLNPNVVGGSGKSRSRYFSIENGAHIIRISDHELPDTYTNDASTDIILPRDSDEALQKLREVGQGLIGAGKPLASKVDQTETQAFRKWFGNSRVVDADGKPLVVYHGTKSDVTAFDPDKSRVNGAFFFTEDSEFAGAPAYTGYQGEKGGGNVMPVFLAIDNPKAINTLSSNPATESTVIQAAREDGYDGIHVKSDGRWIAFRPEQIKSAIGNSGQFDAGNPDIRFSRSGDALAKAIPKLARNKMGEIADNLIYNYQDRFYMLPRMQKALHPGVLPENMDPNLAVESYPKVVSAKVQDFHDDMVKPFIEQLNKDNLSIDQAQEYVNAKDAPDRNREMKAINPTAPELDALRAEQETIRDGVAESANVKAYIRARRDLREAQAEVEDGVADQSAVERVEANLATIQRTKEVHDFVAAGDKLRALKSAKQFEGDNTALSGMSDAKAAEVIAKAKQDGTYDALERASAAVDAITASTRQILVQNGLAKPEAIAAWEARYPHYVPRFREEVSEGTDHPVGTGFNIRGKESKRATGSTKEVTNILAHVMAQHEAAIIRSEKVKADRAMFAFLQAHPGNGIAELDVAPKVPDVDAKTGLVTQRVDPRYKNEPNVLTLKIDGEEHTIAFNKDNPEALRLAASMKNLIAHDIGEITQMVGKFTKFLATMNTAANPVFTVRNFLRDIGTAFVNLTDTELADVKRQVFADIPKAMKGFWNMTRGNMSSEWAKRAREFRDAGGQAGFLQHYRDIVQRAETLEKQLSDMGPGKIKATRRTALAYWNLIQDANLAVENAVRLSAYVNARKAGLTQAKAVSLSNNMTVNFSKHGAKGVELNMWYMFLNASIQGTARLVKAAGNKEVQKILGYVIASAFLLDMLNRGLAGDDDDDGENDYDQLPDYTKANNFIFWVAGRPITIPMPYGYNFFASIGRMMSEAIGRKNYNPAKSAVNLANVFVDAFSPMGQSGSLLQFAAPTIADPFVQWAENKNFAGQPLRKEQLPFGVPKPEYQMGFKSTSAPAKALAEALNSLTGGNEVRGGLLAMNPAAFDFAVTSLMGGAGRTYLQMFSLPIKAAMGDEIQAREVPVVNIFASAKPEYQVERKFIENLRQVQIVAEELKHYRGDPAQLQTIRADHAAEIKLIGQAKLYQNVLEHIRKQERLIEKNQPDGWKEREKALEDRKKAMMGRFNKAYVEAVSAP